ncbi:unnamed protein product [Owenia fusiformis]|uniref:phospholipase A2 n=1 Tax=Owenia fusiformis TaxID=6347 RepID=A0A8J1TP41_OWEFU|nr:unnamed protein product [Owenia fusiformis]
MSRRLFLVIGLLIVSKEISQTMRYQGWLHESSNGKHSSYLIGGALGSRAEKQRNVVGGESRSRDMQSRYTINAEDMDTKCELLSKLDVILNQLQYRKGSYRRHGKQLLSDYLKAKMALHFDNKMKRLLTYDLFKNLAKHYGFIRAKQDCRKYAEYVLKYSRRTIYRDNTSSTNRRMKRFSFMYPGTKWCGPGHIARGLSDLGPLRSIDMCCRAHDLCPRSIDTWETKYNVFNYRLYRISDCACDDKFRQCLQSLKDEVADEIGNMYFNTLEAICFVLRKTPKCVEHTLFGACNKYSEDASSIHADLKDSKAYV